jgi:hypothetical protein
LRIGEVAFVRSGDKGDIVNLSVIPIDPADWDWLREALSAEFVRGVYERLAGGEVRRFELPGVPALNFVLAGALSGGVSRTLAIDPHGKSWGALLLQTEIGARPAGVTG